MRKDQERRTAGRKVLAVTAAVVAAVAAFATLGGTVFADVVWM
jgi:hypothetical protein